VAGTVRTLDGVTAMSSASGTRKETRSATSVLAYAIVVANIVTLHIYWDGGWTFVAAHTLPTASRKSWLRPQTA